MGRQVNFYMNQEDENEFLEFVKGTGKVDILPYKSQTSTFEPLEKLPDPFSEKFSGGLWLFNRGVSSNLLVEFVPTQGYYSINPLQSSVIEFTRSGVKEKYLRRGRLWAEFTYLDKERMILLPKEPEFGKWYDAIAKWVRGKYDRLERLIYAGPGAQKLLKEGYTPR